MEKKNSRPKPDDRSDNVEKIQQTVENTLQNIDEAKETMARSPEDEKAAIRAKNKRREETIDRLRDEITDEYNHNQMDS